MKPYLFAATFITLLAAAAAQSPLGTISRPPDADTRITNEWAQGTLVITNRSGQSFNASDVQNQLSDLHRIVEDTLPALSAIKETYSSSGAGIGGVLGSILGRNTNAPANSGQSSGASTNVLGSILQGVLGATSTNAVAIDPTALRDIVALQEHLERIQPILQRLNVMTNSALSPTGRPTGPLIK